MQNSVTLAGEARAIKYAADNGAVILQCSWGYNSSESSIINGYTPGDVYKRQDRYIDQQDYRCI